MQLTVGQRWGLFKQGLAGLVGGQADTEGLLGLLLPRGGVPPRRRGEDFLAAYSTMPWLRAVVHKVAFGFAAAEWSLYVQRGETREEYTPAHPLRTALIRGVPGVLSGHAVKLLTSIYFDLRGEAFWLKERNGVGAPTEFWPLPPTWVASLPTSDRPYYQLSLPGGRQEQVPASEMVWFKEPDPVNPYTRGVGTAESLADELATDEHAAKFINRFFYNGARPDLIITGSKLSEPTITRLEERWNEKLQGLYKAFRAHFMNADVKITELGQNLQHLQFTELRRFERDTIVQVYGVPPELLGIIENSNRATIEAADYLFAQWVLRPRLAMYDAVLQTQVAPEYDENLVFAHDNPVPENREQIVREVLDINAGQVMTVNERRAKLGLDETKGGDVFLVPLQVVPTEDIGSTTVPGETEVDEDQIDEEAVRALVEDVVARFVQIEPIERKGAHDAVPDLAEIVKTLARRMNPVYRHGVNEAGKKALREVGVDPDAFSLEDPRVRRFLRKEAAKKIKDVSKTTRDKLAKTLAEGVADGESIPQLAERVSAVFAEAKGSRARTIARTETIRASNFGAVEGYQQSGVVERKEWIATRDDKTRDEHSAADGQTVALDEPFDVGGEDLMYPGDPTASAATTINCRCAVAPIVEGGKSALDSEEKRSRYWRAKDADVQAVERKFRSEVVKGMQEIQNDVMDRLTGKA